METLRLASCMAENTDALCRSIAEYIAGGLGIRTEYICDVSWQERERLLDEENIHICWICGLPYVLKADRESSAVELLVVPVPEGERYRSRPVYFSDIVVRQDSRFYGFEDLRGSSWAYNEPRSHSGYNVVRYYLANLGEMAGYFGRVVESGSHQMSLRLILDRQVDAAAIDSTVLEWHLLTDPEVRSQIRIVESLGPSRMPPWVVSRKLPEELRIRLRALLLGMHENQQGRRLLAQGRLSRFALAVDSDYDVIREMARKAEPIDLGLSPPLPTF